MPKLNIPVQFTGVVRVEVPNHLSRTDAKLLATKLALARILATQTIPTPPKMTLSPTMPTNVQPSLGRQQKTIGTDVQSKASAVVGQPQYKRDQNMCSIDTGSGTVDYETIRKAMGGEPFTMSLTDEDEIRAVIEAVNEGIDSYLEACYCPDRGDKFEGGKRRAGKLLICRTLDCVVSVESFCTLDWKWLTVLTMALHGRICRPVGYVTVTCCVADDESS